MRRSFPSGVSAERGDIRIHVWDECHVSVMKFGVTKCAFVSNSVSRIFCIKSNNPTDFPRLRFSRDLHPEFDDHASGVAVEVSLSSMTSNISKLVTALLAAFSLSCSTSASTTTPTTTPTSIPRNPNLIPTPPAFNANYLGIITIKPYQQDDQPISPSPCNPGELKHGDFQLYIHAPGIEDLHGTPVISNVPFLPLHLNKTL
jgi:hypothetical protein